MSGSPKHKTERVPDAAGDKPTIAAPEAPPPIGAPRIPTPPLPAGEGPAPAPLAAFGAHPAAGSSAGNRELQDEATHDAASAAPELQPEAAPTPTAASLFELDTPLDGPGSAQSAGAALAVGAPQPAQTGSRSTTEFLFELDAPTHAPSRETDLGAELAPAAAREQTGARAQPATDVAPSEHAVSAPARTHRGSFALDPLPELRDLLTAAERPRTIEEQLEQRLRRCIVRIQTCRDAFRVLGSVGIQDADRKAVARMLMEIDGTLGRSAGEPSAINDPQSALTSATKEQLEAIERLLGPIEERLLLLDATVPREVFEQNATARKQTKKVIARYGRLLASRRFQPDQRRNRFEWIATLLLTTTDARGVRHALPPERARPVLQHLVGDLPYKVKQQELTEALQYLRDAHRRLQQFVSADEFFESGFYVDLHGYKVTMRDQLLVPEFLYLSAVVNAAVTSRVEIWIQDHERLHSSHQIRQEGSPREQIMRGLRAQEDAVDAALERSVRRPSVQMARAEPASPAAPNGADAQERQKPQKKAKTKSRPQFEIIWDRNMIALVVSVLLVLGSGGFLALQSGAVGAPQFEQLQADEVRAISPLLAHGWIVGDGQERTLRAGVQLGPWQALDARGRHEEADRIAKLLQGRGIKHAQIEGYNSIVIQISDGLVMQVEGGKL